MRWRRGVKVYKVRSVDTELEELSKLNKDNVVRVMDRSQERSGEKLSSESGLYMPKRDAQEEFLREKEFLQNMEFAPRKISFREASKTEYKSDRSFSSVSRFSEETNFSDYDNPSGDALIDGYDDYDSDFNNEEDFSVASMFQERPTTIRLLKFDDEEATEQEEKTEAKEQRQQEQENQETRQEEEEVQEEQKEDQAAALRRKAQEAEHQETESFDARIRPFYPERMTGIELEESRVEDEASSKEEIAAAEQVERREEATAQEEPKINIAENFFSDQEKDLQQNALSPEKERQLKKAMKKIQGAATPKERLAAEREAIRLGMVDALVDSDGDNVVHPEMLDEMGFTPGGEKKEKQAKKKRFWFFRKEKKSVSEEMTAENAERLLIESELEKAATEAPQNQTEKLHTLPESHAATAETEGHKRIAERKTSRSAIMRNPQERDRYIMKIKNKIEKAKKDYRQMQDNYDELTDCLNDLVLLNELPDTVAVQIRKYAQQVLHYQREQEKLKNSREMEDSSYLLMSENSDQMPAVIKRLGEDEAYVSKIKSEIDRLENEKAGRRIEKEETEEQRRHTKRLSIIVIVGMLLTITLLVVLQFAFELDMQLPILLFGVCAVLVTLSIFVRFFRTESDETVNMHMLNRIIKKQNQKKAKYVNALNGVQYVYNKYQVQSSAELLYLWEKYQRVHKDREDYKSAVTEVSFYERRLLKLLDEYGLKKVDLWASRIDYFAESGKLEQLKGEMNKKRNLLKRRMEKCQKVISNLKQELSVLVIKFPQYAREIKMLIEK